jgi:uncharacterized protein YkwD
MSITGLSSFPLQVFIMYIILPTNDADQRRIDKAQILITTVMKKTPQLISSVFLASMLAVSPGCKSRSTDSSNTPKTAPVPVQKRHLHIDIKTVEKMIHDRINQERLKHNLPTIRWDDALSRIAGKHSKDMATKNYFSHTSPEGHGYFYRYQKNGYACGITVDGVILTGAENIFQVPPDALSSMDAEGQKHDRSIRERIAASAVQEWLANPHERKNILSPTWQREGVGIAIGPDDRIVVTLNFC